MQTIGSAGRLLRISSYSTAGTFTWTLQPDVGFVVVELVGGGGGGTNGSTSTTNGGNSSFGSHCSATGGSRVTGSSGGAGGIGSGGNLNIEGRVGQKADIVGTGTPDFYSPGSGGCSFLGSVGHGGDGVWTYGGGGGGGYSKKIINRSALGLTESAIVGAGGNLGGRSGVVIIYEYSL